MAILKNRETHTLGHTREQHIHGIHEGGPVNNHLSQLFQLVLQVTLGAGNFLQAFIQLEVFDQLFEMRYNTRFQSGKELRSDVVL